MNLRAPRLLVVSGLASPLVGGLFRPVLIWPERLEERLSDSGLQAVLVHELAHLRRHDHWVRWLEGPAACLWWWNPLFRLARSRVRQYAELACDAWVLAVLPQARRAYADALVEVCARVSRSRQPLPALGIEGEGDFQRRLTMIMREKVACRLPRRTLLVLGALALLLVPGFGLGQDKSKPADTPKQDLEWRLLFDNPTDSPKPNTVQPDPRVWVAELDDDSTAILILNLVDNQDRDKKLAELEAQIKDLLKEIQALKGKPDPNGDAQKHVDLALRYMRSVQSQKDKDKADKSTTSIGLAALAQAQRKKKEGTTEVITLTRITYALPPGKATALAGLLKDHVKATPLEANVDGNKLIVTTTPDKQEAIKGLIGLLKAPEKSK
jgi:hypothetical protein